MGIPVGQAVLPDPRPASGRGQGDWFIVAWAIAALPLLVPRVLRVRVVWDAFTYLPLHTVLELAIALVGFATFAVQWYAAGAHDVREARARLLGATFLAITILEILHLLAFPGMPGLFGPSAVERGIYYWLLGRAWMVCALALATLVPPGSEHFLLRRGPLLAWNVAGVALAIAIEPVLPRGLFYRSDTGLTPLKIGIEVGLALLAAVGAVLEWRAWRAGRDRIRLRLAAALGLAALGEICFAVYRDAYDFYNLLGHGYTLGAAALVFDGLFVAALLEPYSRLDRMARELAVSNARTGALRAHVEGELASTIARLEQISAREEAARTELEAAFAAVPEGIVVYSPDGRILRTNAAAQRMLGFSDEMRAEAIVQRWARLNFQTTDGKPAHLQDNPVVRALRGEVTSGVPLSMETPDGRRMWVSVSAAPVRAPDGRLDGAVAAIADIGTIQRLQSQREDLLRAVSHDLRNPLQVVLLQAERLDRLLAGTPLDKERASAARIAQASKQMGAMIRDLVEAARVESGGLEVRPRRIELLPFLERLLAQAAGALDVARVRLEVPAGVADVLADPARLERIVLNLVGNALKYSPDGSEVRVAAAPRDGFVQISVADRGVGIAPEDLPLVFDRFYRAKQARKADGLGLGLYIVRLLVEAHGGRVWAESAPGEGATFSFTVPRAEK